MSRRPIYNVRLVYLEQNPERIVKTAFQTAEESKDIISRAEASRISFEKKILTCENQRQRITALIGKKEKDLRHKIKTVQALLQVGRLMLLAVKNESKIKSISDRLYHVQSELSEIISKLETQSDNLEKIRDSSLKLKEASIEILARMRLLISDAEKIFEKAKRNEIKTEVLRKKNNSLITKAKDIDEAYH